MPKIVKRLANLSVVCGVLCIGGIAYSGGGEFEPRQQTRIVIEDQRDSNDSGFPYTEIIGAVITAAGVVGASVVAVKYRRD